MIRLGEVPAGNSVEEIAEDETSPVLRFLARLLTLLVAFLAWLVVLIGVAAVLLAHLLVAALARGTSATVNAVVPAEAAAKNDLTTAAARLWRRRPRPRLQASEASKRPVARII